MPRYHFQITGAATHFDREGYDLPDLDAAWSMAISSTGELLRDIGGAMPNNSEITATVSGEDGAELISLSFKATRKAPGSV
jgi:hypothetical protein